MRERRTIQQLLVVLLFFLAASQFPLLGIFNKKVLVGGWPLLYVGLFGLWAVLILAIGLLVRRRQKKEEQS
jgi:FtsH-binding integral membrane protein